MATRDRRGGALRSLDRLRRLAGNPAVIVVDDGSTDGTTAAVEDAFPEVRLLRHERSRGVAAARTAGVRAATTAGVAFSDDDSWWAPGALARAAQHLRANPRLGLVAARILVGDSQRLDPACADMAASPLPSSGLPGPRLLGFVACGAVVRREAFLQAGGFPEDYVIGGEEEPLALMLAACGWDLAYLDDVVAHHDPGSVARDGAGRRRSVARNDLWTAWRHRRLLGALEQTASIVWEAACDPDRRRGVGDALMTLPAALRARRPVPSAVEKQRRLLQHASPAPPTTAAPADWVAAAGRRRSRRMPAVPATIHPPSNPRAPVEDRCAVVVMSWNRAAELDTSLRRLAALPERPHVVVVDNGSTDGTAAMVRRRHPQVELIVLHRNIGAAARNLVVQRLTQPYVAFADDDTSWEPCSLRCAADLLDAHPDMAVVTARILVEPDGREDPVVADMRVSPLTDDPRLPGHPLFSFLAGASVVRRAAFTAAGGFEPRLHIGGEEELLAADLLAAGWQLRYIPALTVHHAPSRLRDAHRRRADGLRNTLWCTWLRRPLPRALWRTAALLRRVPRDGVTLRAIAEAIAGLPWVLRERRLLPAAIERQYRLLDHAQLDSSARRYIS